ncbi:putative ribonuclease H-like domain-containing protein [Tanacetum coccineum]
MLADSKLPTTFWAEAVNTACYVRNRVIIVKPHNKTPYELFRGRTPALNFMRPFGCHVSILNTLDHLGKFDGKSDDGFFVGYSMTIKAFRVYNIRTRRVEENLHIRLLEDKPIALGNGPKWLFDIDSLTKSINYVPVIAGTNSNNFAGSEVSIGKDSTSKETDTNQDYIVMPLWKDSSLFDSPSMNVSHDEPKPSCDAEKKDDEGVSKESGVDDQEKPESSTSNINTARPSINTASANLRTCSLHINTVSPTVLTTRSNCPQSVLDIFSLRDNVKPEATNVDLFGDETEIDMSNLNASYHVVKAFYGLHQATRAWFDTLAKYLLDNGFHRGKIDQTLFIKKQKRDILLVQVYVDDIIFGSTKKELCLEFEKLMHEKFQMSSMGELTFSLDVKTASTPMDTEKSMLKDSDGDDVDVHLYRLISWQCKKQTVVATSFTEAEYVAAASCCGQDKQIEFLKLNASSLKYYLRGGYLCPCLVGDKAVHKELGDRMERASTTTSSLEAEQDSGNINRIQSMATLNEPIPVF